VVSELDAAGQSGGVVLRREADALVVDNFEVDGDHYVAVVTDGKGVNGTRISVPNNNMKWDKGNPTGHGIIFMGVGGMLYCYVALGGRGPPGITVRHADQ
jgi:hypothetical protein